jgi:CRISPR/Cas system-associated exonuclease Cas4 (RecB family)
MPAQHSQADTHLIRASEIGQYAYCAKAWWLSRVEGVQPSNLRQLEAGRDAHARHGAQVVASTLLARVALACLALGGLLAAIWLISSLS